MKLVLIILALSVSPVAAAKMERCSYKTERHGKIYERVESPSLADGENKKRFASIATWEANGEEGWKGYRTFDVNCVPLDDKDPSFHMFVQTRNGQVSLAHGLTEDACFYTLRRLNPERGPGVHLSQGSDFERGECFK